MGTSPFIGAGQFRSKAYFYYQKFYLNPKNTEHLFLKAFELGIKGVQLLPYPPVVEALRKALEKHKEVFVVGTLRFEDPLGDLELLPSLGCRVALLHGALTDNSSLEAVSHFLKLVEKQGMVSGVVTHTPRATLSRLLKKGLEPQVTMVPFNKAGLFMDCSPEELVELARRFRDSAFIVKKVLGAGRIPLEEAFAFLRENWFFESVAIGLASEEEVEEAIQASSKTFNRV